MHSISKKAVQNSNILHQGINNLRNQMKMAQARPMSTILNSADSKVIFEQHSKDVFEFKLNVNKTLNSLDLDMVNMCNDHLKTWHDQEASAPRVAMISGTGGKAFCAGGDIVSVYKAHNHIEGFPNSIKAEFFSREYLCDYTLTQMKPT